MKRSYMTRKPYQWRHKSVTSRPKPQQRICPVCGKAFMVDHCRLAVVKGCSLKCAGVLRRNRSRHICSFCKKEFERSVSQVRHRGAKYCSHECWASGYALECSTRQSNDRWGRTNRKGDKAWQKAVRERDQYTCQRCGKADPYIHAHHVAPRARRPDLIHNVSNGKCLCNVCHSWVHEHPIEATALGLLSGETYELARKKLAGTEHGMAKFKAAQVQSVRARYEAGERAEDLAEEFGVERSCIFRMVKRETYKNVA